MDFAALAGTWNHMVNYANSLAVAMDPPIPPRVLQDAFRRQWEVRGGGVVAWSITFRFLKLKAHSPYSAFLIGRAGKFCKERSNTEYWPGRGFLGDAPGPHGNPYVRLGDASAILPATGTAFEHTQGTPWLLRNYSYNGKTPGQAFSHCDE